MRNAVPALARRIYFPLLGLLILLILLQFPTEIMSKSEDCSECSKKDKVPYRFALLNLKGEIVTFSKLIKENNIIVAFWASYCLPCRREVPQLIDLEKKYGKSKNIKLVLVNTDKEGKNKAVSSLKEMNVINECLLDIYQVALQKYSPKLQIPATFLINKQGELLLKIIGESKENLNKIEKALQKMK